MVAIGLNLVGGWLAPSGHEQYRTIPNIIPKMRAALGVPEEQNCGFHFAYENVLLTVCSLKKPSAV